MHGQGNSKKQYHGQFPSIRTDIGFDFQYVDTILAYTVCRSRSRILYRQASQHWPLLMPLPCGSGTPEDTDSLLTSAKPLLVEYEIFRGVSVTFMKPGMKLLPTLVPQQTGSRTLESAVMPPPRCQRVAWRCRQLHKSQAALEPSSPFSNLSSRVAVHSYQPRCSLEVTGF